MMDKQLIEKLKPLMRTFGYDQKYVWDKLALKQMSGCKRILDVGCGIGRFIAHDPKRIEGVDHSKSSLAVCKKNKFKVTYGKVTQLPFADASFDAVHCSHVIEHLVPIDAHKLLSELSRVVKRNGLICIRTPLLYPGFYDDFSHIKPYNPESILHYLRTSKTYQRTLDEIDGFFKLVELKYRREQLFFGLTRTPFWFLAIPFNILQRFGISSFKKTGYMLILKKK